MTGRDKGSRSRDGELQQSDCHLANKPVDIEVPQAVLPDTVFEAVVRILYDMQLKQVLANGKKGASCTSLISIIISTINFSRNDIYAT